MLVALILGLSIAMVAYVKTSRQRNDTALRDFHNVFIAIDNYYHTFKSYPVDNQNGTTAILHVLTDANADELIKRLTASPYYLWERDLSATFVRDRISLRYVNKSHLSEENDVVLVLGPLDKSRIVYVHTADGAFSVIQLSEGKNVEDLF